MPTFMPPASMILTVGVNEVRSEQADVGGHKNAVAGSRPATAAAMSPAERRRSSAPKPTALIAHHLERFDRDAEFDLGLFAETMDQAADVDRQQRPALFGQSGDKRVAAAEPPF